MDAFNVRSQNVKSKDWFEVGLFSERESRDLARALDASPLWCMVTLTRDAQESVEDWRE